MALFKGKSHAKKVKFEEVGSKQAVSRGRNKLEVDENWNSEICEQLFENLRNTL
jgi:hypothetical protein